jgi:hypothetical protein
MVILSQTTTGERHEHERNTKNINIALGIG